MFRRDALYYHLYIQKVAKCVPGSPSRSPALCKYVLIYMFIHNNYYFFVWTHERTVSGPSLCNLFVFLSFLFWKHFVLQMTSTLAHLKASFFFFEATHLFKHLVVSRHFGFEPRLFVLNEFIQFCVSKQNFCSKLHYCSNIFWSKPKLNLSSNIVGGLKFGFRVRSCIIV